MVDHVSLELLFINETDNAIFVKDEEESKPQWVSKTDVIYDDTYLVPGMTTEFDVRESVAIECGFV